MKRFPEFTFFSSVRPGGIPWIFYATRFMHISFILKKKKRKKERKWLRLRRKLRCKILHSSKPPPPPPHWHTHTKVTSHHLSFLQIYYTKGKRYENFMNFVPCMFPHNEMINIIKFTSFFVVLSVFLSVGIRMHGHITCMHVHTCEKEVKLCYHF